MARTLLRSRSDVLRASSILCGRAPQRLLAPFAFLRLQPPLLRRTRRFGRMPRRRPVRAARELLAKPPEGDAQILRARALVLAFHRSTGRDRKSTRLNSSHLVISYAVF